VPDPRKPFGRRASDRAPLARLLHAVELPRDVWTLLLTVLTVWALVLASQAQDATNGTANDARVQVGRVDGLVQSIQDERIANTRSSCETQNTRNLRTKRELRARVPDGDERRLAITVALIDALAPVRDCDVVVAEQTGKSAAQRP
jgi:hypothetical protein